jgi:hypothetical protein
VSSEPGAGQTTSAFLRLYQSAHKIRTESQFLQEADTRERVFNSSLKVQALELCADIQAIMTGSAEPEDKISQVAQRR